MGEPFARREPPQPSIVRNAGSYMQVMGKSHLAMIAQNQNTSTRQHVTMDAVGVLHRYGRGSSMSGLAPIKIDATLDLCRAKDATWEDFERILLVEETLLIHILMEATRWSRL